MSLCCPASVVPAADVCSIGNSEQAAITARIQVVATANPRAFTFSSVNQLVETEWVWDFGDGAAANSATVEHPFAADGTYLVSLLVANVQGQMDNEMVLVSVGAQPDLATPDHLFAEAGKTLLVEKAALLANDASGVAFHSFNQPQFGGVLFGETPTTLTYQAPSTFAGQSIDDAFFYQVSDATERTQPALVTVTVTKPDPVAGDDLMETGVNIPLDFTSADLLGNDTPGATFGGLQSGVLGGVIQDLGPTADGLATRFRFTPQYNFIGPARFTYGISWTGQPPYVTGNVQIEVVDRGPWSDLRLLSCADRACTLDERAGDDLGIVEYSWDWGDGTFLTGGEGPPIAQPTHVYEDPGQYTVKLTVRDTAGHVSNLKMQNPPPVTTGLNPAQIAALQYPPGLPSARVIAALAVVANTAPIAQNDPQVDGERDITKLIPVMDNDNDPDHDAGDAPTEDLLTIHSVTLSHPGAAYAIVPHAWAGCPQAQPLCRWAIRMTPPDSYVGVITGTYVISDPLGATASATFAVNFKQWDKIIDAVGEQTTVPPNAVAFPIPYSFLLSNDYDEDTPQNQLSIDPADIDKSLLMGTLTCDTTRCLYNAPPGGSGMTMFTYKLRDAPADGHFDTAIVRLYVGGTTNASPTTTDDYFKVVRPAAGVGFTRQDVVQNDVDPLGDTLTVVLTNGAREFGAVNCTSPMYSCVYSPEVWAGLNVPPAKGAGFTGVDRFNYSSWDLLNPAVVGSINVLSLPNPLTAPMADRVFDAREDTVVATTNVQTNISFNALKANDYDPEGQPITITAASIDTTGMTGTMTCDATSCLYSRNAAGTTKFKYTATDSQGNKDTAVVKIKVSTPNNAPVILAANRDMTTPVGTEKVISVFDLLTKTYDPDNDPLNVTINPVAPAANRRGVLTCGASPHYRCTFQPNPGWVSATPGEPAQTFVYTVSDGAGGTASGSFTIIVQ
jgi:large repetitive protein